MNALVPVGHQAWADIHGNGEGNFEANSNGDDKLYSLDPTCTYQGFTVPAFVMCSESRSNTSETACDTLTNMFNVQWNTLGAQPFLILDGHDS